MHRPGAIAVFAFGIGLIGPALAEPGLVHVPYRAVFAGVEVGTGALTIEVIGRHYRLALDAIVLPRGDRETARATANVTGNILRSVLAPDHYSGTLERGGTKSRVALGFANGALAMVAVLPPPDPAGSGRTRPPPQQSRGIIDPLTALAVPAGPASLAPLSACGRTQRVFDGMRRYDITMFPSRVEPIEIAGKQLSSLVCRAEMRTSLGPVTDRQRRPERWPELRPRGQHAVAWLAPVAGGQLLVPLRLETVLRFGTLTIEVTDATAFEPPPRAASLR